MMNALGLVFAVFSDVVAAGFDEDGEVIHRLSWFIVAEDEASGRRWAHFHTVVTSAAAQEEPKVLAALRARMGEAKLSKLDPRFWTPTHPRYCSPAYDGRLEYLLEKDAEGCLTDADRAELATR